jgi:hypothetical protein
VRKVSTERPGGFPDERVSAGAVSVPGEDRLDPLVILRDLPERERAQFLRQYHEAVEAAHDPAAYRRLQRVLRVWSLAVIPRAGAA